MTTPLKDFAACYDFSDIEIAIQSWFESAGDLVSPPDNADDGREDWQLPEGDIAVVTAFQNQVFQQVRPRVVVDFNGIAPATTPPKQICDSNGMLRCWLYRGTLRLGIVTKPDYAYHQSVRSLVAALADTIAPMIRAADNSGAGANQYLTNHQIAYISANSQDMSITPEDGHFVSQLTYTVQFAVQPSAWPGGINATP